MSYEMVQNWVVAIQQWIIFHVVSWETALQIVMVVLIRLVGEGVGRPVSRFLQGIRNTYKLPHVLLVNLVDHLLHLIPLMVSILLLLIPLHLFQKMEMGVFIMTLVFNLSIAWVIAQLATSVIPNRYWARLTGAIVWSLAALNIVGLFDPFLDLFRNTGFSVGQTRLSLLSVFQAAVILLVLLRSVGWLSRYFEARLTNVPGLNSSTRLMLSKVTYVTMVIMVTIIVLNSVGIDVSSLAFFSGAIGVGVGFGLQKVVGNYISGLILLSDKSIKPGDVIQLDDAYGWVRYMGGRYVSVVTRDEKEYLIPNEDLITQQVINWSYSNKTIRLRVPFGTSYKSNPQTVIDAVTTAVAQIKRILIDPGPVCLLKGFGDSSVDFELRYWINDPQNGVSNITSQVLLVIWDTLKLNGIEIPFPQRDLHFITPPLIRLMTKSSRRD